jgi:XTP/dITP diphosphohydrolase
MVEIVLASSNKGKIAEIQALLSPHHILISPQSERGIADVEETGLTFIENALIKARHAASIAKLPALADDSGLVVPYLKGEPGIYSARYAGSAGDFNQNIQKLLTKMEGVPIEKRHAYFYCVIVYLRHPEDPCPIVCDGTWDGQILLEPRGQRGFGYDPVFYDLIYECSAAELAPDVKNTISHRGQAVRKLLEQFENGEFY